MFYSEVASMVSSDNHGSSVPQLRKQMISPVRDNLIRQDYHKFVNGTSSMEQTAASHMQKRSEGLFDTSGKHVEISFNKQEPSVTSEESKKPPNPNIDNLISQLRLENKAFSNRVQHLRSKIDTAYTKIAPQAAPETPKMQSNRENIVVKDYQKVLVEDPHQRRKSETEKGKTLKDQLVRHLRSPSNAEQSRELIISQLSPSEGPRLVKEQQYYQQPPTVVNSGDYDSDPETGSLDSRESPIENRGLYGKRL